MTKAQHPKVVIIGAGSLFFGRQAIWQMVHSPYLNKGTLALVDTDEERIEKLARLAEMVITDTGGGTVASQAGTVRENGHSFSEVDGFTCDLYGNYPTYTNWWDNFEFDSVPEPATLVLLSLGGLALVRRRR